MVFSWLRRHGLYSSTLGNPPMRVNWSDLFMWLHWRMFTEGIQAVLARAEGNQEQVEEARKRVCLLSGVCITTWWRACTSAFSQGRLCTQVMSSSNKAVPRCRPVRARTVVLAHSPHSFCTTWTSYNPTASPSPERRSVHVQPFKGITGMWLLRYLWNQMWKVVRSCRLLWLVLRNTK